MIGDMPPTRDEREAKTRECPLFRPPIPEGWTAEAGMYVSRDGDAIEAEMLRDPHALMTTLQFLRRMTALVEWVQRNQALDAFEARRAARQTNPGV